MKHQVSTLTGPLLDRAVALALGATVRWTRPWEFHDSEPCVRLVAVIGDDPVDVDPWAPSTTWGQGGPILERAGISLLKETMRTRGSLSWLGVFKGRHTYDGFEGDVEAEDESALVAGLRALVIAKLGPEVELPDVGDEP